MVPTDTRLGRFAGADLVVGCSIAAVVATGLIIAVPCAPHIPTPAAVSPARRWWRRRRASAAPVELVDDGSLVGLGGCWDPASSDAAVLAAMQGEGLDLDRPLLVRHHLLLPGAAAVDRAGALLGDEGYRVAPLADGTPPVAAPTGGPAGAVLGPVALGQVALGPVALAVRTERVSGLALAQERSRMAGLAQRLGGEALGWDLLGPPTPGAGPHRAPGGPG